MIFDHLVASFGAWKMDTNEEIESADAAELETPR